MNRRPFFFALVLAVAGCLPNDSTGVVNPIVSLEEQTWAASLGINLATMTKLPSGVYYRDVTVGTGTTLAGSPVIRVFYAGYLANGSRFDGNQGSAAPAQFSLSQLIQGWQVGLPGMKVGGKRRLVIPSQQGYGTSGSGSIPANANLVFDVELVGIL